MNAITDVKYLQMHAEVTDASRPEYRQLEVRLEPHTNSVWTYMKPAGRPCFSLALLSEIQTRDEELIAQRGRASAEGENFTVEYCVGASVDSEVFSLGGDLGLFLMLIKARDRDSLLHYAKACIQVGWNRLCHYGGSAMTITLVRGRALGGGFEAALTSDIIIAEESATFGFPEILFNLFPGMGAYSLLSRRVGARKAEELMLSGELYTAEQMAQLGIVDLVVVDGRGEQATSDFMLENRKRANGMRGIYRCREFSNPVTFEELDKIAESWADAALNLDDRDLRMMQRLVRAQTQQQERPPVHIAA